MNGELVSEKLVFFLNVPFRKTDLSVSTMDVIKQKKKIINLADIKFIQQIKIVCKTFDICIPSL